MIPALTGEHKFKQDWHTDRWSKYEDCKKANLKAAQSKNHLNWQEIYDELNRLDRDRLGL